MTHNATRPLVTFAFVKEQFDKTGDIVSGLIPLFGPIFKKLDGQTFSPTTVTAELEEFYGMKMSPWVVEDWVPRLVQAELLVENGDHISRTHTCKAPQDAEPHNPQLYYDALDSLIEYVMNNLANHGLTCSRSDVESHVISGLKRPDFLSLLLKPDLSPRTGTTLSLNTISKSDSPDISAVVDFLLATRILELNSSGSSDFQLVSNMASGALVSEVVANLRTPPRTGHKFSIGSVLYLDSPFLLDLLDLADPTRHEYTSALVTDFKTANATLRTYDHNVSEIISILDATLSSYNEIVAAKGTVAYRLRTDPTARSRAQIIKSNARKYLLQAGVKVVSMDKVTAGKEKYFDEARIQDLISQIRPFNDIFSREVDALSIAGVARSVLGQNAVATVMSLPAAFITKNGGVAREGNKVLVEQCNYSEEAASPFLTERQAAGIMWLALGGAAGNIAERQLLANCAAAVTPRRDVLATMHGFLSSVDERSAREFEALMTQDRCAHYVMGSTLGDATLVTADNAIEILDEIKQLTIADTKRTLEEEASQKLAEINAENAAEISHLESKNALSEEAYKADLAEREERLSQQASEISQRMAEISDQAREIENFASTIEQFQKATLIGCARNARNYGLLLKGLILFVIISVISGLALLVPGWIPGIQDQNIAGMVLAGWFIASVALTACISWFVPDLIFSGLLEPLVQKRLARQIERSGATTFAKDWEIDVQRLKVDSKQ